eukprot:CAMPEP_0206252676 /NCGR_PEP_ID=MMETSP0047_2-20121206/22735_1 /ASSEMBLY_ACC=CAM_ASM_000192 /TAXON_ID=195065 /ORGANISM="Chroomonas mesostigmatica_cf, Strain CCMP1168" /LENGTH=203 /DNA_ID=CAMNT_0053678813 /DNA_START=18 /DNA_END=626 /DNA_ORIENTATION=-
MSMNEDHLRKAWEVGHRSTKDDWREWLRNLKIVLLRESPSPALRSCAPLAHAYNPIARELFCPAFLSCWAHLSPPYKEMLMRNLERAVSQDWSPNMPHEVLHMLLTLAEFMEHHNSQLPINRKLLISAADRCHAFAKSLHYMELEFRSFGGGERAEKERAVEPLMSLYQSLSLPHASNGLLVYANKDLKLELRESWYEMLRMW